MNTYEIQLINAKTNELEQSFKSINMVTNAVKNLLNPPPSFFVNGGNYADFINGNTPIATTLMGGVLLWNTNQTEDVDNILNFDDSQLVGHAGDNAYTGLNPKRGSYNIPESGATETGYKHVWDFTTDQGNGEIKCITLTSAWGGRSGLLGTVGETPPIKPICFGQVQTPSFDVVSLGNTLATSERNESFSMLDNNGFFYSAIGTYQTKTITIKKFKQNLLTLRTNNTAKAMLVDTFTITLNGGNVGYGENFIPFLTEENSLKIFRYDYQKTVVIEITIDLATKAKTEISHTFKVGTTTIKPYTSSPAMAYVNKKLYFIVDTGSGKVTKTDLVECDLTTNIATKTGLTGLSELTRIIVTEFGISTIDETQHAPPINSKILLKNGEIKDCNLSILPDNNYNGFVRRICRNSLIAPYFLADDRSSYNQIYNAHLRVGIFAPYMATIDNITAVTKTASQKMKIICTINDVV